MPESITVHINQATHGAIDVDRTAIETDRTFELTVVNHGEPTHLHLNPGDEIAETLSIRGPNQYVDAGETIRIPVSVGGHTGPLVGTLALETRFGANSTAVDVTLTGGVGDEHRVDVDERLASPASPDPAPEGVDAVLDEIGLDTLALGGLFALALLVGVATAAIVGGRFAIYGLVPIIAGVGAALFLLVRDPVDPGGPAE